MKITTMKIIHIISMRVLMKFGDESLKAEVINNIKRMLGDILKIVGLLNDGDISYDEVNSVFTKIDKTISGR